jgi:hypothetical protein
MPSAHSKALALTQAFRIVIAQVAEKNVGEFENCVNDYLHFVVTFLAEYVESIPVPKGSLSEKQRQSIIGTLLYGLANVNVETVEGTRPDVGLGQSFGSLKAAADVLRALIVREKKPYRTKRP